MPANLPPEYYEAEKDFKHAKTQSEKITTLEKLIATVPKHKGTDKIRANLRKKLSKLKSAAQSKKGVSRQKTLYHIDKEGAGQIALVGTPNVGKSSLLAALTNAKPEIANFPRTTWNPMPGMMFFEDIQIQLIDTPPLNRDYIEPELFNLVQRCDIVLLVVDIQGDPDKQLIEACEILKEHKIIPLHLKNKSEQEKGHTYKPFLVVANKYDEENLNDVFELFKDLLDDKWPMVKVSAKNGLNLEGLKKKLFNKLEIIRVYSKTPGKEPDLKQPFVLKKGKTVQDFAEKVHKDFAKNLKTAKKWGHGVYDGQPVQRDHQLHDGDIVELHI